ncbi:MAG: J domain-containing protein [Candidatus Limnocylindrales bacterium]
MPVPTFRGDPYRVLDVDPGASHATIKRRRRELARELHPDQAAGDVTRTAELTKRMARVNAAYDFLRDEDRRRDYDRAHPRAGGHGRSGFDGGTDRDGSSRPSGPPPPRPTRPVTARFDTSDTFRRRNATTTNGSHGLRGHRPISARERAEDPEPLRASQPNGPVRTRRTRRRAPLPSLEESLATELEFGKFRGHTLGQVAAFEPTYIDWIARTITRDRDLVVKARVIQADLDERGVERRVRPPTPGFGGGRGPDD